jgi:hypothetical protein
MTETRRRLGVAAACLVGLLPLLAAAKPEDKARLVEIDGKVVPLADLVAKQGGKLDADAAPTALVLVTDGGKVYSLVKDGGSRLFFKDPALLKRPMRLTGRLLPGSQILRVTTVNSYVKGELCEVYYWCDVCSIRRGEKDVCECCGGPMLLKEEPVKK